MATTSIEWTEQSWNPIAGCNDKSPGCKNCYARTMTGRLEAMGSAKYAGLTVLQGSHRVWTGKIAFDEKALLAPLRRKKPTRYFVNSMSDLFHHNVTDEMVDRIFAVMALCPQHTFLILTKRPDRMREYFRQGAARRLRTLDLIVRIRESDEFHDKTNFTGLMNILPNVWLGTSTENQDTADDRIQYLLETPAAIRFISAEPLIGEIGMFAFLRGKLRDEGLMALGTKLPGLDWVIVGGESGPGARPFHVEWARKIVKECQDAGVPVFVKQMGVDVRTTGVAGPGQHWPAGTKLIDTGEGHWKVKLKSKKGGDMAEWPEDLRVRQMPA